MTDLESLQASIAALESAAEDPRRDLRNQAVKALSRRDYACEELRRRLLQRCADAALVDAVLQQLAGEGLLNDLRFAESFLRHRAGQGYGPVRIRQELAQRGTDSDAVDRAFLACGIDWHQRAEQVRVKKFGAESPQEYRERAKQAQFLTYRGFASEQVWGILPF